MSRRSLDASITINRGEALDYLSQIENLLNSPEYNPDRTTEIMRLAQLISERESTINTLTRYFSPQSQRKKMSDEFEYGKNIKAIVFEDNDHRHAQLIIKLKHDGFRQAQFFRQIITSYINDDELFLAYIDSIKQHNAKRKAKTQK